MNRVYKELQLKSISLFVLKSLQEYDKKLFKKSIIYYILSILAINEYKKETYSILIVKLNKYQIILRKP